MFVNILMLISCSLPEDNWEPDIAEYTISCEEVICPNADEVTEEDRFIKCWWACIWDETEEGYRSYKIYAYKSDKNKCWELWYEFIGSDFCPVYYY